MYNFITYQVLINHNSQVHIYNCLHAEAYVYLEHSWP